MKHAHCIDILYVLQLYISSEFILMGSCKKDITPLLMHWSYVFLALTHWYVLFINIFQGCITGTWTVVGLPCVNEAIQMDMHRISCCNLPQQSRKYVHISWDVLFIVLFWLQCCAIIAWSVISIIQVLIIACMWGDISGVFYEFKVSLFFFCHCIAVYNIMI